MAEQTFVIVGANLAGGRAAFALRAEGFAGRIILIGAEPDLPYERPPLSKEYLRGDVAKEKLYIAGPEIYEERHIDLLLGTRATRLDPQEHLVKLEAGARIEYDKLLLATGGYPRHLDVPGSDLEGIYELRTIADSERIRQELEPERRLVTIGAGVIGAEIAASASMKGLEVTMIEALSVPLKRSLGEEMGGIYADIHRDHGVRLYTNEAVERFEPSTPLGAGGATRVGRVVTNTGRSIECDFVVVGVGIVPATELAEAAGLDIDNGIVVNEYCETSAQDVYACGDVANFYHPLLGYRLRIEHWSNAQNQAVAAAKSMLGVREPYVDIPWFWSDQYDLNLQYVGHATSWDEVVLRGDVTGRKFTAFYVEGGRLRAALTVNRHRDIRPARELIRQGVAIESAKLKDEEIELKSLVPAAP
jgi:3-phenylpropionate/trans-cinnamate dioxygenase ferredoxin reductase component